MAEGDTVLRAARRLDAALAGQEVEVRAPSPRGRSLGLQRLDALPVIVVEAHGKNLLFDLGDLALHSHLGMNGSWHVYPRGARWRKPASAAWALLRGENQEAVQFGGPTLRVMPAARLRRELSHLGPDVLAPDFDLAAAVASLRTDPGRELGGALLDQHLVAGIGNIFKSESCFAARLNPWTRIADLTEEDLARALTAARDLMLEAVASGRQPRAVYRRAAQPCPVCKTPISSRGQGDANRTTYWCPHCQKISSFSS
jgi:endonuclease-8